MTDWMWCYENPKDAAAEIDALKARVADLKAELKRHIGLHIDTINNRAALEKGDD